MVVIILFLIGFLSLLPLKGKFELAIDYLYIPIVVAATAPLPPEEEKKTLSESAAEYTESHAIKRKYDEVTVVTGNNNPVNKVG